jgi:hypothetical protein
MFSFDSTWALIWSKSLISSGLGWAEERLGRKKLNAELAEVRREHGEFDDGADVEVLRPPADVSG